VPFVASDVGFHRILILVVQSEEAERAVDLGCRLASSQHGVITLLAVVEIPPLLPLDAHMAAEEQVTHQLLDRMSAIVDSYDVGVARRMVRGRDVAAAIVAEAEAAHSELIIIAAVAGKTAEHVLKHARCRVMLVGAPLPRAAAFAA
jgi:nucleotide-binding universal stress UspA family protein